MTIDYDTESNRALRATFANRGDSSELLLAEFEPTPVFFTVSIVRADGTPVRDWGGGKVALSDSPAYVDLEPGDEHAVRIELPAPLSMLPPGCYEIAAEYHNQYGDGCFKGVLPSRNKLVYEASR